MNKKSAFARRRERLRSKLFAPPLVANTYREHDPLISEGLGCMKAQVPEMREVIRKHNIKGVRVRDNGQLEITSRRGRKELLRVRGLADADAGFGDG
jgi:hypothetical protein